MVHARAKLAKIGEADAEFHELAKFMRCVSARRDADLVKRAPEAISRAGVVALSLCRRPSSRSPDHDEVEPRGQEVGQDAHNSMLGGADWSVLKEALDTRSGVSAWRLHVFTRL